MSVIVYSFIGLLLLLVNTNASELMQHSESHNESSEGEELSSNDNTSLTLKFATICTTPNGDAGYCVEFKKCPLFKKGFLSPKHEAYDFVVASNCTPSNAKQLKMCCGKSSNFNFQSPKGMANDMITDLPSDCGTQKPLSFSSRILGGIEAIVGEFPWMARLVHRNRNTGARLFGCSGFLIHCKFILTAAHCVHQNSNSIKQMGPVFQVLLGEHDTSSQIDCADRAKKKCAPEPQLIRVGDPYIHAKYEYGGNHYNDIALIPLKVPVNFTNFIRPICLLDQIGSTNVFTLSGWGATETEDASQVKMKVDLNRLPVRQCASMYANSGIKLNPASQMCAGGDGMKDACTGDSGGPLMIEVNNKWFAEGIVSFGIGCAEPQYPGVYTNIPYYLDWIKRTIQRRVERTLRSRV